jgi:hypothetical protein
MRVLIVTLVWLLASDQVRAQEASTASWGFGIGVIGGVNLVAYDTRPFPMIDTLPEYFVAINGSGSTHILGVSCELPISLSHRSSVIIDLLTDSKSSRITAIAGARMISNERRITNVSMSTDLDYLMISASFKYALLTGDMPNGPAIQLSAGAGFVTSGHFDKIVDYGWRDSATGMEHHETEKFSEPISGIHSIRVDWRAGFIYDIPISDKLIITPQVSMNYPFTEVDRSRSWRAKSLMLGLAIRYWVR